MKKQYLIAAAVALAGVLAPLASVQSAYAEDSSTTTATSSWIQVSPVSSRVVLKPGSSLDYSMIVSNIGTDSFKFNVYTAPYSIVDEDYNVSFSNETNRTQLSRWIKFINEDGSLTDKYTSEIAAGAKQTVNYRITTPEDVPAGGQYATIFAQTEADEADPTTSGIKTVSRIGLIVYGRTEGETNNSAEIVDFKMDRFLTRGPVTATALVKNDGNTDFEVRYDFQVKSIVGNVLYEESSETPHNHVNILPDSSRRKTFEWENTSAMGIFKVTFKVAVSDLDVAREETHYVIIMPVYMIVIGILLLTILTIWIIMVVRKRKERKSKLVA